jgi:phospholipid-translocating ATPase
MEEKDLNEEGDTSNGQLIEVTGEINDNLIKENNNFEKSSSNTSSESCFKKVIYAIFPYFKKVNTTSKKTVYIKDYYLNKTEWSNKIENQKYNLITFIPVVLYNQFKQFGNFFYLIMSVSQFFEELKVGFLFTYISPLAIVVTISMLKELYDDINRRIQDKKTNSTMITVLKGNSINNELLIMEKQAANLLVGDIIELKKDTRVPADIIVLKTYNESNDNQAFIRTDQLDGETDWKLRKAPESTQKMSKSEIVNCIGKLECEPPSKLIYNFQGTLTIGNEIKEPLNLENTIWASTVIASQGVLGIVIYTGKESRARMNSSTPKLKIGVLDQELNKTNAYLFIIMLLLSLILTFLKGFIFSWKTLFIFIKFMILFCAIIPIALRVNLDVSKTWFSYVINKDDSIPETIARNSTIPEELGRVSYVFSDKTGTLTKNEMIFKKISMSNDNFGENNFNELKEILEEECSKYDAPLLDLYNLFKENDNNDENEIQNDGESKDEINTKEIKRKKNKIRRERNKIIRDTITAMLLCNNVTPIIDEIDKEKITYQASSPDEIALVKFAETLNMKLFYRTDKLIKIKNTTGTIEEFEILANFPFSSETKRMGIILKSKKYGHIIFYLKGAENVMKNYAKEEYIGYINENAENLATKGLRTLVLTQKLITEEEFNKWNIEFKEASTSMENRKEKMAQTISKLENNMDFLCVTGVEDLLQDEVATTIENLRNAGMKIWMLTGDKVETATCISISAGIKGKHQKIFTLKSDDIISEDKNETISKLKEQFNEYNKKNTVESHIFIIDGELLDLSLKNCEKEFFETTKNSPSVVCCRCSPTQKRIVVKTIKNYIKNARTAAVGDGGNDVAMIQEADVGIGIVGKEGLQASLAADYSIKEFKSLNILLLWWGRLAYKNTSTLANFVIHKGLIISINQFIFSLMFYYNAVALYNGMLSLGYSTVFTCLPAISILLDQDIDKENVLKFPTLYRILLKGRELNLKNFLWWLFKSVVQSGIIMFGAMILFSEHLFLKIVTVSFTALIYLELLNVYMEINKFHRFMWFALISTCAVYTLSLLIFPNVLDIAYIFKLDIFWRIVLISIIAWAPFFITSRLKKILFPQEIEKLKSNK